VLAVPSEAARRRTFAIISHPDAGKTTLTEKFLLYAGAIQQAGAVQSRKADRATTSDWLELEQQRGISVTSAVARFEHDGTVLNLLDTPGHRDFSEDTYRVLSGVDAAVMVIDAARGVEPQTEKLYAVCRARGTPGDHLRQQDGPSDPRAARDPRRPRGEAGPRRPAGDLADQARGPLRRGRRPPRPAGLPLRRATPPVGRASPRRTRQPSPTSPTRSVRRSSCSTPSAPTSTSTRSSPAHSTPVFFGSALSNFGVRLLLDAVVSWRPPPGAAPDVHGIPARSTRPSAGSCSRCRRTSTRATATGWRSCGSAPGASSAGTHADNARTGKRITAKYAHAVFGRDRETVDEAFPGDVIGLVNATDLRAGDTLPRRGRAGDLPAAADVHARSTSPPPTRPTAAASSSSGAGSQQLDEEGVVQVLRHDDLGDQAPIWAAVGRLQFDVAAWRMEHEFGAPVRLEGTRFEVARATDEKARRARGHARRGGVPT
jgi:peptide chain release factor 3